MPMEMSSLRRGLLVSAGRVKVPDTIGPQVVAPSNMFLRNAFDTDPSMYLGRFIPDDALVVDESSAMPLTCSQHITYREIGGGGVIYDEYFNASTEAAARVGVPVIAGVGGTVGAGAESSSVVRIRYELVNKMVAEPSDPGAFEACCKQAPDQCTGRYVGEFLSGKGAVWYASANQAGGKGGGTYEGIGAEVEVKNGVAWERSIEFPNPVYFAFKTTENRWTPDGAAAGGCGDWVDAPPRSSQGKYFVGLSDPMGSERVARDAALRNGRVQTVQYLGEQISTGGLSATITSGDVTSLTTALAAEDVVEAASTGIAKLVKDESWCIEPEATPEGNLYVAKVLVFLPKASEAEAARAVVDATSGAMDRPE